MPIINLTIKGKQAIGDGTAIVCMNSDYVVRIAFENCDTLVSSPYKSLVVKSTLYYQESPISEITDNGTRYLQATLPAIENQQTVELGVCGRDTDNILDKPKFSSIPASFKCVKSILCGAVVLRSDPKLSALEISENGIYKAAEHNADGFYEVDVHIPAVPTETRTLELDMSGGHQLIEPTKAGNTMTQVKILKPETMSPGNIVKGVNIGGVVGTFEKRFTEQEIFFDGEYTPPDGYDGFSKVKVTVAKSRIDKTMRIGDSFTYDYDMDVKVEMDTAEVVSYWNNGDKVTFTANALGMCIITITNLDYDGNVVDMLYYAIEVNASGDHTLPAEMSSTDEMYRHLERGIVDSVVKYTGKEEDGFVAGATYIVKEVE